MKRPKLPKMAIPKDWTVRVRTALLHVIALAQYVAVYTRAWAANSPSARVRLQADKDQLQQEVAWLKEELRVASAWVTIDNGVASFAIAGNGDVIDLHQDGWAYESTVFRTLNAGAPGKD